MCWVGGVVLEKKIRKRKRKDEQKKVKKEKKGKERIAKESKKGKERKRKGKERMILLIVQLCLSFF